MDLEKPPCTKLALVPFEGYEATCTKTGEKVKFGVNKVVLHDEVGAVCAECQKKILEVFGRNGKRTLGEQPYLPTTLGRSPFSKVGGF